MKPSAAVHEAKKTIVVLPGGARAGRIGEPALRRWLARARLQLTGSDRELLVSLLAALDLPPPADGLAALRLWGQTGTRPTGFVTAADPVYLEPLRDRLALHALSDEDVPAEELRALFAELERTLAPGRPYSFRVVGSRGYIRSTEAMATAPSSAARVTGEVLPMPDGAGEGWAEQGRLQSELEMCLHASAVNRRREEEGRAPVNALWLWGGGIAAEPEPRSLPALFGDDPLVRGYWLQSGAAVAEWPGSLERCFEAMDRAFVALVPPARDGVSPATARALDSLRSLLDRGALARATVLFADGLTAQVATGDRWRFWRRSHALLQPAAVGQRSRQGSPGA